jgi:three-Cys-motif partner protein
MEDSHLLDDGLLMDDLGPWSEDKYKLVGLYVRLFATGMKFKWEKRVYIDLYSGAGIGKVRGRLVMGSPLIALTAADPFDLYIFCEVDEKRLGVLRQRAERIAQARRIEYVAGDCNAVVDKICSLIPRASPGNKVLSLCFVDPYDIGIKFSTIAKLSTRFIDFLVLLAVYMVANRNLGYYERPENKKVDEFLGLTNWRELWEAGKHSVRFPEFLARQYSKRMTDLDYIDQPLHNMKKVRNEERIRLYTDSRCSRAIKRHTIFGVKC